MKKILLIIALIFCIFQMVVLAVAIDIGCPAINRAAFHASGNTLINTGNPANASGKITSVQVYALSTMSNCVAIILDLVDTNTFTARDYQAIGTVTSNAVRTFDVDLDVEAGDYLGIYFTDGSLEKGWDGVGIWYKSGDYKECVEEVFTFQADGILSLYGTGTTEVGWSHKWNTQTISKWNTKEFTKWNGLE